jgi:SAM-dependent methyltransferase
LLTQSGFSFCPASVGLQTVGSATLRCYTPPMQVPPSPMSLASTWDLVADDYAREIQPAFERYAEHALWLADVQRGMEIVDVATGPGTLALLAAQRGAKVQALDFAPAMVAALRAHAERERLDAIVAREGDGQALPYADGSFDAGFSMFGLMFFPDRAAGFRELLRVLRPGGRAVVSSWAPIDRVPVFGAALAALWDLTSPPGAASSPPAVVPPLTNPESCRAEMTGAGFRDVVVHPYEGSFEFDSCAEMIASFGRSSAPFALAREKLGAGWPAVERSLVERVAHAFGAGPQRIVMPALLTLGVR